MENVKVWRKWSAKIYKDKDKDKDNNEAVQASPKRKILTRGASITKPENPAITPNINKTRIKTCELRKLRNEAKDCLRDISDL